MLRFPISCTHLLRVFPLSLSRKNDAAYYLYYDLNVNHHDMTVLVGTLSFRVQELNVRVESKTLDNVFLNATVSVQYCILAEKGAFLFFVVAKYCFCYHEMEGRSIPFIPSFFVCLCVCVCFVLTFPPIFPPCF